MPSSAGALPSLCGAPHHITPSSHMASVPITAACPPPPHTLPALPCPSLLSTPRHSTPCGLQVYLQPLLGDLLDERVLAGSSRACSESLRHAALSTLGELVGSMRKAMSALHVSRALALFGSIMVEAGLPVSTRAMCLRVVLALVEPACVQVRVEEEGGRGFAWPRQALPGRCVRYGSMCMCMRMCGHRAATDKALHARQPS